MCLTEGLRLSGASPYEHITDTGICSLDCESNRQVAAPAIPIAACSRGTDREFLPPFANLGGLFLLGKSVANPVWINHARHEFAPIILVGWIVRSIDRKVICAYRAMVAVLCPFVPILDPIPATACQYQDRHPRVRWWSLGRRPGPPCLPLKLFGAKSAWRHSSAFSSSFFFLRRLYASR